MKTKKSEYQPEEYWSEVASRIEERSDGEYVAGDDEPFYRYKREKFLSLLTEIPFDGLNILEVGPGPGGNLKAINEKFDCQINGADISQNMIDLATENLGDAAKLVKIDGTELPFNDRNFDLIFTATVLQHNTDDQMMKTILKEIARVSNKYVYLFERIEHQLKGDDLCMGRPVSYYSDLMNDFGYKLDEKKFINIRTSYLVSGAIRKIFNPKARKEGEGHTKLSIFLQNVTLPITKVLDSIFKSNTDLARLKFVRKEG